MSIYLVGYRPAATSSASETNESPDLSARCLGFAARFAGVPQDLAEELKDRFAPSRVAELADVAAGDDESAAQLVVGAFQIGGHDE